MTSSNPNLVPTIESSALPSPANEWAESTNSMLAHKFKPSTPLDGPTLSSSLPEGETAEGGSTLLDSLPAKEDVHRTIGKAAKAILPERIAAYLPVSESELAPPRPPFASEDTDRSNLSNLSTEAQAGSLMPPRADSASTLSTLSSAPPARDGADSQLSTTVHTGGSASPHPVSPLSASPLSKSGERLPVDADGATPPAFTASPAPLASDSRESPLWSSEKSGQGTQSEGRRAPPNSLAMGDSDASAGPDAVPPPAPHGVLPVESNSSSNSLQ